MIRDFKMRPDSKELVFHHLYFPYERGTKRSFIRLNRLEREAEQKASKKTQKNPLPNKAGRFWQRKIKGILPRKTQNDLGNQNVTLNDHFR